MSKSEISLFEVLTNFGKRIRFLETRRQGLRIRRSIKFMKEIINIRA